MTLGTLLHSFFLAFLFLYIPLDLLHCIYHSLDVIYLGINYFHLNLAIICCFMFLSEEIFLDFIRKGYLH